MKYTDAWLRDCVKVMPEPWCHVSRELLAARRAMRKAVKLLDMDNGFLATHGTDQVVEVLDRALSARVPKKRASAKERR